MTEALAKGPEEAIAQSESHINDYLFRGAPDTEAEDVEVGNKFGVGELIKAAWDDAKAIEDAWLEQAAEPNPEDRPSSFLPETQPPAEGRGPATIEPPKAQTRVTGKQLPRSAAPTLVTPATKSAAAVGVEKESVKPIVAETGLARRLIQRADGSWWSVKGSDVRRWLGPPPKPKVIAAADEQSEGVIIALKPQEQAKPKPESAPEPESQQPTGKAGASFATEIGKDDDTPAMLSKASPYDSAREFVRRHCFKDRVLAVYWWNGSFWQWNNRCYEKVSIDKVNADVWAFLDDARARTGNDTSRFKPKPADAEGVVKALKAGLTLNVEPPCWLDGRGKADGVLVFKNGIVDIATGRLEPLDARLWTHHAMDFDYDPRARCPTWERFLDEVFEGDPESRDCVEEQLGLGMTEDIRFQKGFLWIGTQGREGKGTLAAVLERLCGGTGYVSLAFHTWLKGEFSAEAMIGKRSGVFPDVRFKEAKWYGQNFDPGGIDHVSKEMLLKITGGDHQTFARKYNPVPWQGVLPMKVFLVSNDVPNLNDQILVTRFIKIAFNVSFRGREDHTLLDRLKGELPGIANRCLRMYRRLCERGRLIQPESGIRLSREIAAKSNPWEAFIEEQCVIEDGEWVTCSDLLDRFEWWCNENERPDLLKLVPTPQHFSKKLKKEVESIRKLLDVKFRPHDGKRQYLGFRLKEWSELR
jgi:putative DNA primase/helicase